MDEQCVFCKIIDGQIPSATLYSDEDFKVILDVSPASKGHALILVKEHYQNIYDLPDELASKVLVVAKKIAAILKKTPGCTGINILQNNGESAGQTVFHFHVHIIPRYKDDKITVSWECGELTDEIKQEITQLTK